MVCDNPSIRFCNCTEAWEKKPFGEVFIEYSDKNHEDYPVLMIVQGTGTILRDKSDRQIQYDTSSINSYKLVRNGDFIVHLRSFEGGLEKANCDGLISPAYHTFHGENALTSFYYPYFRSELFVNVQLRPHIYGIRDGRSIDIDGMRTILIPCPTQCEQAQIGCFLEQLDSLVSLHQQKYSKLLSSKKAMLQKLFPTQEGSVPELRFEGFDGAWEWRKLSEISDKVTEKNVDSGIRETFTNSAEFGVVSQRDFFDHDISNTANISGYYIVRNEDFVYNPRISVTAPVGPISRNKLGRVGVMSPLYTVIRTHDVDTTFLEWYFKSPYWYPFMRFNGDTGVRSDRFSIKDTVFFNMPIPFPSLEEQRTIGAFFDSLEELIQFHAMRIEKFKNIKAACLEGMFV